MPRLTCRIACRQKENEHVDFHKLALPSWTSEICLRWPAAAQQEQQIVITGQKLPQGYELVTSTVQIADLNLATSAGVAADGERVAHGVATVCPTPGGIAPSYEQRDYEACQKFAWAALGRNGSRSSGGNVEREAVISECGAATRFA